MGNRTAPSDEPGRSPVEVSIWFWSLAVADGTHEIFHASLDETERRRLARLREGVIRDAFLAGRGMMRAILAERLGCAPRDVPLRTTTDGKPMIGAVGGDAPIAFNLSHTGLGGDGLAVLAVAEDCDIGVDLETIRPVRAGLAKRYFAPEEVVLAEADPANFFALWTAKEACLKAWGRGIQGGLDRFVFAPPMPVAGEPWTPNRVPDAVGPSLAWQVVHVPAAGPAASARPGVTCAVAVRSRQARGSVRVDVREAAYPPV